MVTAIVRPPHLRDLIGVRTKAVWRWCAVTFAACSGRIRMERPVVCTMPKREHAFSRRFEITVCGRAGRCRCAAQMRAGSGSSTRKRRAATKDVRIGSSSLMHECVFGTERQAWRSDSRSPFP